MILWSKGLGKRELPFKLAEAQAAAAAGKLELRGMILAPKVRWDYKILLDGPDVIRFVRMLARPIIVRHLAAEYGLRLPLFFAAALVRCARDLLLFRGPAARGPSTPSPDRGRVGGGAPGLPILSPEGGERGQGAGTSVTRGA